MCTAGSSYRGCNYSERRRPLRLGAKVVVLGIEYRRYGCYRPNRRVGKVHIKQCGVLCGHCDLWHGIRQHQMTVIALIIAVPASDSPPRPPRRSAASADLRVWFGSVPAGTNLCSYWFGLGTAMVGSFDHYLWTCVLSISEMNFIVCLFYSACTMSS